MSGLGGFVGPSTVSLPLCRSIGRCVELSVVGWLRSGPLVRSVGTTKRGTYPTGVVDQILQYPLFNVEGGWVLLHQVCCSVEVLGLFYIIFAVWAGLRPRPGAAREEPPLIMH